MYNAVCQYYKKSYIGVSDLLIYAEMGKKVSYETDFPFLGELDRSVDAIKLAEKKIELTENKIFYSLLCFNLNDNFERESIEFIKQGDFKAAIDLLKNEIDNNSPLGYYSTTGENITNLLKSIEIVENINYSIQKEIPPASAGNAALLFANANGNKRIIINNNVGFIDINKANHQLNLLDKYQISCNFKWLSPLKNQEESLGLGFLSSSNEKHVVLISQSGVLRYIKSENLEFEKQIDVSIFNQNRLNFFSLQRYDNHINVIWNNFTLTKIKINEAFKSSFLCFSGIQKIAINHLFISGLKKKELSDISEINEKSFSYIKNTSLIFLIIILKNKKMNFNLISYFEIVGNFLSRPYFNLYAAELGGIKSGFNLDSIIDKFILEFYYSLYQLIDHGEEYAEEFFYGSFGNLSQNAKNRVKKLIVGSKPYALENFIKKTIEERKRELINAFNLANDLKNEATYFFNWYSKFYPSTSLESKSISDKIGNEILECAIAYYNASTPKTIEHAKLALKILTWASDFAFNQALRDRINVSISILLKAYPNTGYKIVDFGFKDGTRTTRRITPIDKPAEAKTNNIPEHEANISKNKEELNKNKSNTNTNRPITAPISKHNKDLPIFYKIIGFLFACSGLIVVIIIYFLSSDNKQDSTATNNQLNNSKPVRNKIENYSVPKDVSRWVGNKLQNGDSPYDDFFGEGIYDYHSECWITFKNGNSTDAIVCLVNNYTGTTIRNEYIRAGTDYKMTNIPEGVYKVKVFYGNDWNPGKTLNEGSIKGVFDTDFSFSLSDNSDDLIHMNITRTDEGIRYTTGEITLYTVSNGNMNQRNINSNEFFK